MDAEQLQQEEAYGFPYHHVVKFPGCSCRTSIGYSGGFSQVLCHRWGINYAATIEFLLDRVRSEDVSSVVDVGCGDGRLTKELKHQFPGMEVVGIDYSKRAVALAKAMDSKGEYHCLDISKSSFPRKFQLALVIETMEHIPIPDVTRFLHGLGNLLDSKGLLYLTVPHVNVPVSPKHYQHFTFESLRNELEGVFQVEEEIPFEQNTWRKRWIDRVLVNRLFILNNKRFQDLIYRYYKNHLFRARTEGKCQRIFVRARLKHAGSV